MEPKQIKLFENLYGDENRYEQILINFISNAMKFSNNDGTVKVILQSDSLVKAQISPQGNIMISAKSSSETQEQISTFLKSLDKNDVEKESKSSYQLDVGKQDFGNLLNTPSIIQQIVENKNELYFNRFSIKIIDDGEGISEEGIKNLFVDFGNL